MISFKLIGQRENCNYIFIPFFMYTVTPHFHCLPILKKSEERKHKGKGMKI